MDALDEAAFYHGSETIVDLLAQLHALPPAVRCIVTSRIGPHLQVLGDAFHLSLDARESQEDIAQFAQLALRSLVPTDLSAGDEGARDAHVLRTWF